jgi:hypothetical protein
MSGAVQVTIDERGVKMTTKNQGLHKDASLKNIMDAAHFSAPNASKASSTPYSVAVIADSIN